MRTEGKMVFDMWLRGFPDFALEIKDIIVEGNRGAMRLTFAGTQTGEFGGLAPTGKRVLCTESLFVLVRGGKIAEAWEDYDELGMWRQLGLKLPNPS
jgi:predicted ester cyclase